MLIFYFFIIYIIPPPFGPGGSISIVFGDIVHIYIPILGPSALPLLLFLGFIHLIDKLFEFAPEEEFNQTGHHPADKYEE